MRMKSRQKQPAKAHDIRLESQTGEAEGFGTLMRRMARDNKLAVLSAIVILLMVLAAVFAPFLRGSGASFPTAKTNFCKAVPCFCQVNVTRLQSMTYYMRL